MSSRAYVVFPEITDSRRFCFQEKHRTLLSDTLRPCNKDGISINPHHRNQSKKEKTNKQQNKKNIFEGKNNCTKIQASYKKFVHVPRSLKQSVVSVLRCINIPS